MRWSRLLPLVALGALGWACTSDHDVLAKQKPGTGGSGGAAGAAGAAGSGAGPGDAGQDVDVEPPGPSVLTLMHGVVDAERVGFCFAKVVNGVAAPLTGSPVPSGGLHYGGALSLAAISGIDLVADDLQPVVIAASQGDLTTKGCQALADEAAALSVADAGVDAAVDGGIADASADAEVEAGPPPEPPAVRAGGRPALPAGTLASDKSILLVAAGCFGAPGFVDPLDNVVCGQGYAPDQPTLAPVLVQMSRIKKSDRLGLAVVNASVAGSAITVRSVGPEVAALPDVTIAVNVGVGAISPKPPNFGATTAALGFSQGDPSLDVSASNNVTASVSVPWKNAVAPAGTGEPKDGETYAIVMLGPQVNVAVTKWWNPVGISVVTTDPQ